MRSDAQKMWDEWIQELTLEIKKQYRIALRLALSDFFVIYKKDAEKIFNDVIRDFYNSYSPVDGGYHRNESLYNILNTQLIVDSSFDGAGMYSDLEADFDPKKVTPYRNGYNLEGGLYDRVFRKGWHGGAGSGPGHPKRKHPYWRTPLNVWSNWGREAEVSAISPFRDFKNRVVEYEKNEGQGKLNDCVRRRMQTDFVQVLSNW